jgi:hypothetical protein
MHAYTYARMLSPGSSISCCLHCRERPYSFFTNNQEHHTAYPPTHQPHPHPGPRCCAITVAAALAQQPRRSASEQPNHPCLPPLLPPLPACPSPQFLSVIAHTCARPSSTAAVTFFNDVYRFSASANNWTPLSPSGSGPSPRRYMGFESTPDGMLYVFGGEGSSGIERGGAGGAGGGGGGSSD